MSRGPVCIATRGSPLALAQTEEVRGALAAAHPDRVFEIRIITTKGDRIQDRPLPELGGKGLFTEDLEKALRKGEVAMAVHSAKDLPVDLPEGLSLGCTPRREDPRDVLVARGGRPLDALPGGSRIGTSSPRRKAQLLFHRADLEVVDLRGNVQTRLRKVEEGVCDAAILAHAGLRRLGLGEGVTEVFDLDRFIPPAGQGAIGIEVREGDDEVASLLRSIGDGATLCEVEAEMACLRALGGGCKTPIGVVARVGGDGMVLRAGVFSADGRTRFRTQVQGAATEAGALGREAARELLEQGAAGILAEGDG